MKTRKTDQPGKGDLISTADQSGGAYAVVSGTQFIIIFSSSERWIWNGKRWSKPKR